MRLVLSPDISRALTDGDPVVALESTVVSQGLPYPENLETIIKMREAVAHGGARPATIAMFGGAFHIGLDDDHLRRLANGTGIRKISVRDIPIAMARRLDGATTVASTVIAARAAGIRVFATGGIGGVHRGGKDVSADLPVLAENRMIVVCSGAKAILDLPATREWLETYGIPVLGFGCDEMPAFYSVGSGLAVDERVDSGDEVAEIAAVMDRTGRSKALLVTVPVPEEDSIRKAELDELIRDAAALAESENVTGKELTPFLLSKLAVMSDGGTLRSNISLLLKNAEVAARIAVSLSGSN